MPARPAEQHRHHHHHHRKRRGTHTHAYARPHHQRMHTCTKRNSSTQGGTQDSPVRKWLGAGLGVLPAALQRSAARTPT